MIAHEWRLFRVALQFLTRLPAGHFEPFDATWLTACVRHFPLVGLLVGACGAAVLLIALPLWGAGIAAALALTATIMVSGGFHEDGLADSFDALGGVVPREKALAILKDSRIGSYGALALILGLGLRWAALTGLAELLQPLHAALALIGLHGLARWAPVAVMAALPYGGDAEHAKAKPLALGVSPGLLLAATVTTLPAVLLWSRLPLGGLDALALLAALAVAVLIWTLWLRRRLGGYTGDGLGACEQTAEILLSLTLMACLR